MTKAQRIAMLRYAYTARCKPCGVRTAQWPGRKPDPEKTMYQCPKCKREMDVEQTEVRTRDAAELIVEHQHRFAGEQCPDCGAKHGHHLRHDTDLDAYFLHCGNCGEEMREVLRKELK